MKVYDTIIVGAGPAGLTAAIFARRREMTTLVISTDTGGQTNLSSLIENYPGVEPMPGHKLMEIFFQQAKKFGAEFVRGRVTKIKKLKDVFKVKISTGDEYTGKTIILAFGKTPRTLEVPGEDKFMGKGISTCATCLPPKEIVIANFSPMMIRSLTPESKVLTIDGTFQKITEKLEREYKGNMIEIKTRFFTEPVHLTENHPVLKLNVLKGKGVNYWNFEFTGPEWVQAKYLKKNDMLLYPVIKETKDKKSIFITDILEKVEVDKNGFVKNKFETFSSRRVPNEIFVNKDFMRLVGYYLSEGCITSRGVNIYFNKKESEYIEDVKNIFKNIFKITPTIRIENKVCRIMVFSNIVRDFFETLFGKYAHNKKLPHWMMFLPVKKQSELIKGFWRGDGCKRDKDFCMVTNSKILTYQIRDILLRLEIIPSIQIRKVQKLSPSIIDGRKVFFKHDKYHIVVGGPFLEKFSKIIDVFHERIATRKRVCRHAFFKDNFVLLPIRQIKQFYYEGKVYNIAVEKNNTYIAKNFIVHNCDAPLFRDKVVAVVGGGNSALDATLLLDKIAKKIYLIHRRDEFRADEILVERAKKSKKIEFVLNSVVTEFKGDNFLKSIIVKNKVTDEEKEIKVDGVFLEIGYVVKSDFIKDLVKLNKYNEIIVDKRCRTSCDGVFAAGDVTDVPFKQTIVAAGEGAKAGLQAYIYLHGEKMPTSLDWDH